MGPIHSVFVSAVTLLLVEFKVSRSSKVSGQCSCLDPATVYRVQNVGTQLYVDWLGNGMDLETKNLDSSPTNKQTFMFDKVSSRAYKIRRATDQTKFWEVRDGVKDEGTTLTSNVATGNDDIQIFYISEGPDGDACYIRNEKTRKFVDGQNGLDGAVSQSFYSGSDDQLWKIMPTGSAKEKECAQTVVPPTCPPSGTCSNFVAGQSYRIVLKANSELHISWENKEGAIGYWESKNRAEDYTAGNTQMFTVEAIGGGLYKIRQDYSATARILEVFAGDTVEDTNVGTWSTNNKPRQKWKIQDAGDGYCYIMPNHTSNRYLDGRKGPDDVLKIWGGNSGDLQKWKFVPARCGTPVECDVCVDRPETTTAITLVEGSCDNFSPYRTYRIVSVKDYSSCWEFNPSDRRTYLKPKEAENCNQAFKIIQDGTRQTYKFFSNAGWYVFQGNGLSGLPLNARETDFHKLWYNFLPVSANTCHLQSKRFNYQYLDCVDGIDNSIITNNLTNEVSQEWTFVPVEDNSICTTETTTQFQTSLASTGPTNVRISAKIRTGNSTQSEEEPRENGLTIGFLVRRVARGLAMLTCVMS